MVLSTSRTFLVSDIILEVMVLIYVYLNLTSTFEEVI